MIKLTMKVVPSVGAWTDLIMKKGYFLRVDWMKSMVYILNGENLLMTDIHFDILSSAKEIEIN